MAAFAFISPIMGDQFPLIRQLLYSC